MKWKPCRWPHMANATYEQPLGETGMCRDPWCLRAGSCAISARIPRQCDKPAGERRPRLLTGWWIAK